MKEIVKIFQFLLLMCGVFGADEDEVRPVSVMEGDSVTLNPDLTKIQGFIQILWRFGSQGSTIAAVDDEILYENEEIFKDRLQLDHQTGSLTIKNMKTKHSGRYKAEISHSAGALFTQFIVTVYESPSVIDPAKGAMKIVSVTEGDPVTLQTDVTEVQGDELIVWRSGDEGKLIAKHDTEAKSSLLYDTDERFRDRLMVENKTGSLIITNTRTTDSGLYKVKISSRKQTLYKRFTVTVSDSGLFQGAVAGIVVVVLLVSAAVAAAGVMHYRRRRTTNLPTQTWSVPAGDTVTLNPETEIQTADEIQWLFRDEDTLIAGIRREDRKMNTYEGPDEIFRDRLKLDETTGSLTIKLLRTKHNGLYTLKIRRGKETLYKRFIVSIEERKIRVMEGNPVNLYSDTEIQRGDEIQWLFDDKEKQTVLAEIKTTERTKYGTDERFRDRLKMNTVTGSLTVTKFTAAHSGVYILKIRRRTETSYKRFFIFLSTRIAVMEGDPVTLNPATEINKDDVIRWMFGDGNSLIAELKRETGEIVLHDDVVDGRFRGRLKLDETTGSLTINNTRTTDSGVYHLEITSSRGVSKQKFFVNVKDKVEKKSLNEGDSVTLNPDTEIQRDDQILWMFGAQDHLIAQIRGGTGEIYDDGVNKRFRDRLKLDETGSLTITDISTEHKGLYKLLTISSSRKILFKKFKVLINFKYETATAGESVTLKTGLTEIQTDDVIRWMFGDGNSLIAELKGETGEIVTHDDVVDGRFRDGLKLDETTGSLTINNTRTTHSGVYHLQIRSSSRVSDQTFIVTVKVTDKVEKKSLTEGDSVTLNPDTEIQRDDQILWMFGAQDHLIAQIRGGTGEIYDDDGVNKRFRGRLKLDETGSLTITDISTEHKGLYKLLTISSSRKILFKKFKVLINFKCVPVTAGASVTLKTGRTEIQTDDVIRWMFRDEETLVAEIKGGTGKTYDVPDQRFRDRLKLNKKTGDLTISNSTAERAGHYKLKIRSSEGDTSRTYIVFIRDESRKKSEMKEKNDSRGKRGNESATVEMQRMLDVMNEEEGTSSLY